MTNKYDSGDPDAPYRDPGVLSALYHDKGLSLRQVADRLGCDNRTIRRWMERHEIPTRSQSRAVIKIAGSHGWGTQGYEYFSASGVSVRVHRLVAIASGESPHDVFSGEYDAHHKNGVKWDNRPSNIELLPDGEHQQHHVDDRAGRSPEECLWRDKEWMLQKYQSERLSARAIAKEVGASKSTIQYWIDKHGIEKRSMSELVSEGKLRGGR